ncbi:dihydrofolate reductase [Xylophilus rhododendri]|uniref:Dihydrofolate reductase n=1 Tax=Xylophilus rhododendri TaxID=2697032 RepID=A0A857JB98_9BURK|nr:dihydrofolate reductase [Xylophilus rhododendri]QHJ00019.1 dihydrofolate reductase [Xylophilus rhododendri]
MAARVHLIFARAANGVIGLDNALPWHLPEDMAHFRTLTRGCPVLMGRRTWDSLPPRFRPLPGRRNIVLTRQPGWAADGAEAAAGLAEALALCADAPVVWVIGGAQIYAEALPFAHAVEVTEIHRDFAGDALAPVLEPTAWRAVSREDGRSADGLDFSFVRYERNETAA